MSQHTPLVESLVVDSVYSSSPQQETTLIQPAEETLFEHEVIELESFNERKAWIEEKISASAPNLTTCFPYSHTASRKNATNRSFRWYRGLEDLRRRNTRTAYAL